MPDDQIIYIRQPKGFEAKGKEHLVWCLYKALYGIKQGGHLWYHKLHSILLELRFHVCKADPCIVICSCSSGTCYASSSDPYLKTPKMRSKLPGYHCSFTMSL